MVRKKLETPRGVLHVTPQRPVSGLSRYWPSDDLAPFVEHYWIVAWSVDAPTVVETLPQPSVHLVVEPGVGASVSGVTTRRFTRTLEGTNRVVSVKFRPGGFRPFLDAPVSTLRDRIVPLSSLFGASADRLEAEVVARGDVEDAARALEAFLRARSPVVDDNVDVVAKLAARIETDREITRVEHVASVAGLGVRTLQRLFDEYVGVSPKWVIQRFRLLEAAERIAAGVRSEWVDLALDLGYSDQAHFIRDFKRLVGSTPAEYARSLER